MPSFVTSMTVRDVHSIADVLHAWVMSDARIARTSLACP
jgi:hypothetical protein